MDLLSIGNVGQYVKGLARQTQWELKKQSGDYSGHKKSLQDYVSFTKASSVLPRTDEQDTKLSTILTKAQAGKKLSYDDWEYLRTKSPELYNKLREAEQEQKNYEKALRRCKTKDEAQRLHVSKLGEILEAAKNGDEGAIVRLNRLTQSMNAFTQSRDYHELPTEAEEAIEREAARQERKEALEAEAEAEIRKAEREAASETEEAQDSDRESVSNDSDAADAEKDLDRTAFKDRDAADANTNAGKITDRANTDAGKVTDRANTDAGKVTARTGQETVKTRRGAAVKADARTGSADASSTAERSKKTAEASKHSASIRTAGLSNKSASVLSTGRRAYLDERGRESRRRKSFHADA